MKFWDIKSKIKRRSVWWALFVFDWWKRASSLCSEPHSPCSPAPVSDLNQLPLCYSLVLLHNVSKLYKSVKTEPLSYEWIPVLCRSPVSGDRHEDQLLRVTQWSAPVYTPVCDARFGPVPRATWSRVCRCPRLRSSRALSSSSSCYFTFPLSSVHIGGPQNALCSLAGYLFVNVILLAMNMLMYSFWDMLCIRYVEMSVRTHTAGVYVCMCSAKKQKPQKKDVSPQNPQIHKRSLHPSHWIQMCHYLYVPQNINYTVSHTHTCILYRIKNVPWRNERLTIYFFYVFKGEPSSDVYRKCCNDMKIKILLCVNYSTINCLY